MFCYTTTKSFSRGSETIWIWSLLTSAPRKQTDAAETVISSNHALDPLSLLTDKARTEGPPRHAGYSSRHLATLIMLEGTDHGVGT